MKLSTFHILILRLAIGGLFLYLGVTKINTGWLTTDAHLLGSLRNNVEHAQGAQLWYLENIAVPYVSLWAKLIAAGEAALGVSLILGLLVRLSSSLALFMVMNLLFATGNLLSWKFFGTPNAGILLTGLLVILLARGGRWAGVDALLAKSNPRSILW